MAKIAPHDPDWQLRMVGLEAWFPDGELDLVAHVTVKSEMFSSSGECEDDDHEPGISLRIDFRKQNMEAEMLPWETLQEAMIEMPVKHAIQLAEFILAVVRVNRDEGRP